MNDAVPPHAMEVADLASPVWDLRIVLGVLRSKVLLVLACIVAGLAAAIIYIVISPSLYEARTVIEVAQEERAVVNPSEATTVQLKTPEILKTIEQNLSNGALLLRVFKTNRLDQDPRYQHERGSVFGRVKAWLGGFINPPKDGPPSDSSLIEAMDNRVDAKLRRGTRLVDVTVQAEDATLAQQLSSSVVAEYIKMTFDQKLAASKTAYDYLVSESDRLKAKLEKSELHLQSYRESTNAVSLDQTQNIVVETLKRLNTDLDGARSARIKIESDVAAITALESKPEDLPTVAGISASTDVQTLKTRVAQQEAALASIAERYDTRHPSYLQASSEVAKLKVSLTKAARDVAEQIKSSLVAARATEDKLQRDLKEQEKQALELNRITIQFNVLMRDVESDRAMYESVLKQLKEIQIIQGAEQAPIRIIEPPTVPDRPVHPRKLPLLALGLALGLMTGVGSSLWPTLFRAPFHQVVDAEVRLGVPALASIPKVRMGKGTSGSFLAANPRSPASEAVRSLRAMLSIQTSEETGHTFMFSSAVPGEGKTFCAVNHAASLALSGRKTLLIDGDLRVPAVGARLFGKEPAQGLSEVLSGKMTLESAVQPGGIDGLSVLSAGSMRGRPAELFAGAAWAQLMADAAKQYDCVVVDTAPVLCVSDSLKIASSIQQVCLVVRASFTSGAEVQRALHLLAKAAGGSIAGFVLNQTVHDSVGSSPYGTYGDYS